MTIEPYGGPAPTILVVMGVAGAGKSTLARAIADRLKIPYLEADDLHPPANVAKMSSGQPLTDADRWPWLDAVAAWIDARARAGEAAVVACSALKRRYRERLAREHPSVRFAYVTGSPELVTARMKARRDHYFPVSLIASQFDALEPPEPDENAISVNMELPLSAQVERVLAELRG